MRSESVNDETSDDLAAVTSAKAEARGAQGIYPMRVAVQLTGLTPDTIRAWERRYQAIEPVRSAGNTRKFTHDDVRRLLLLRQATEAGHSIGNIAELDDAALRALLLVTTPEATPLVVEARAPLAVGVAPHVTTEVEGSLEPYFELITRFDVVGSAAWLRRVASLRTPRGFVLEVVAPMLAGIRERRADARLGGPHVVAAWQQLSATLNVLLDVTASPRHAPALVAIGAPRQRHALGAMASVLLARHHGHEALFLGAAMPDADIQWSVDALGAAAVVVDLSAPVSLELGVGAYTTLARMATRHHVWVLWPAGATVAEELAGVEIAHELAAVDALLSRGTGEGAA